MQIEEDPNTGLLWLSRDGHIFCCSRGLNHLLGHTPADVEGSSLQSLGERILRRCAEHSSLWLCTQAGLQEHILPTQVDKTLRGS